MTMLLLPSQGLPHFTSKYSTSLWEQSVKAYGRLESVAFTVTDGRKKVMVRISGKRAAQTGPGLSWTYDGKYLRIRRQGHLRRIKVPVSYIPAKIGLELDPFLRSWCYHQNPVRTLGSPDMVGRLAGSVDIKGMACDVIELKSAGLRLTVLLRRRDHLLARTSSESTDASGRRLSSADREYEYLSIGKPMPASIFR